jgi:hypothetical protein
MVLVGRLRYDISYWKQTINNSNFAGRILGKPTQAAQKAVYLAIINIQKKWSMPIHNWGYILHQFLTIFQNRCRLQYQLLFRLHNVFYTLDETGSLSVIPLFVQKKNNTTQNWYRANQD